MLATVSNNGLVTGVASGGPVTITAITADGSFTAASSGYLACICANYTNELSWYLV